MAHYNLEYAICDVDDSNEDRNLNNFFDSMATERNVYITSRNVNCRNDQNLSFTDFNVAFFVTHRTSPDTNSMSEARIHSSYLSFSTSDPFERFASADEAKALVMRMLTTDNQFPFYVIDRESGQSLFWMEFSAYDNGSLTVEPERLENLDGMITRISEAVARTAREASESGRNFSQMIIQIDKRTVVPRHEFERILTSNHDSDNYDDSEHDDYDEAELYRDGDDYDDEAELDRAIEQSFAESAMQIGPVPAAKSVVEALEKFKYEGSSKDDEDESKLIKTCVICMEEVVIGSQLTRMPCSHLFHGDCIARWLHGNHTCPLCRFELPSQ